MGPVGRRLLSCPGIEQPRKTLIFLLHKKGIFVYYLSLRGEVKFLDRWLQPMRPADGGAELVRFQCRRFTPQHAGLESG